MEVIIFKELVQELYLILRLYRVTSFFPSFLPPSFFPSLLSTHFLNIIFMPDTMESFEDTEMNYFNSLMSIHCLQTLCWTSDREKLMTHTIHSNTY